MVFAISAPVTTSRTSLNTRRLAYAKLMNPRPLYRPTQILRGIGEGGASVGVDRAPQT